MEKLFAASAMADFAQDDRLKIRAGELRGEGFEFAQNGDAGAAQCV